MKKLLNILLCLTMLASLCACGNQATNVPAKEKIPAPEGALTLEVLQQLQTQEELAKLIGVENAADMPQMLIYLRNFYYHLPAEGESSEPATEWSTTDEGYHSLTTAQAKTLITPTVITTENWKDYVEARIESVHNNYFDENDNEVDEYVDEPVIAIRSDYHYELNDFRLLLTNNLNGEHLEFCGGNWPEEVSYEDGKYYVITLGEPDENGDYPESKEEFDINNYTCTLADGVVYSYDLDPALLYVESMDEETWEYSYLPFDEAAASEDGESYPLTFIQYGETNTGDSVCLVGYDGLGGYVYTNEESVPYVTDTSAQIAISPTDSLTLEALQQLQTKEELAAMLGVFQPDDMPQMLVYLENFYNHLPAEGAATEPVTEWSTTDEGYHSLTVAHAKTLITPTVVTTENWMEYLTPHMETVSYISCDDDGNEVEEKEEEPAIGIDSDVYDYAWDSLRILLVNNKTGEVLEYADFGDWPEEVSYEDGKYMVTCYDENGFGTTEEFDPDNYTCVFADCVVYTYEISPELLYVEYYDETTEDWVVVPADEYNGEEESSPMVFIQYGETDSGICRASVTGLGEYVFTTAFY